jgi:hypothetical protein
MRRHVSTAIHFSSAFLVSVPRQCYCRMHGLMALPPDILLHIIMHLGSSTSVRSLSYTCQGLRKALSLQGNASLWQAQWLLKYHPRSGLSRAARYSGEAVIRKLLQDDQTQVDRTLRLPLLAHCHQLTRIRRIWPQGLLPVGPCLVF